MKKCLSVVLVGLIVGGVTLTSKASVVIIQNVPDYTQSDVGCDAWEPQGCCGRITNAMILAYWDDFQYQGQGPYEGLVQDGDRDDVSKVSDLTKELYEANTCQCAYDEPTSVKTVANNHRGYSFDSWLDNWVDWEGDYKGEINAGRPIHYIVGGAPEYGGGLGKHGVLGVGYDDDNGANWLIIHDNWVHGDTYLDWDSGFMRQAVKITPGGVGGKTPCQVCSTDSECGDVHDYCISVDGMRCGKHCDYDTDCPNGYGCVLLTNDEKNCLPKNGDCDNVCVCSTTYEPCCDGCNYRPSSYPCADNLTVQYSCKDGTACGQDVWTKHQDQYCSGSSSNCDGSLIWDTERIQDDCSSSERCSPGASSCQYDSSCVCDCSSGACCDGCSYRPSYYNCEENANTEYFCQDGTNCGDDVYVRHQARYCSGYSAQCNGSLSWGIATVADYCTAEEKCIPGNASCQIDSTCGSSGDDAAFVSDVTVPDGTKFGLGAHFVKTWRLKNTGTTTWTLDQGYQLSFLEGERFSAAMQTLLPGGSSVTPGQEVDWPVDMIAPEQAGTYRGTFRLEHSGVGLFGDRLWVEIVVDPGASVCVCSSGPCCDGCSYYPNTHVCEQQGVEKSCKDGSGCGRDVYVRYQGRFCSGSSDACDGSSGWGDWEVSEDCSPSQKCENNSCVGGCSGGIDDGVLTSETLSAGTVLGPSVHAIKRWTVQNTGTSTWTRDQGYRLILERQKGWELPGELPLLAEEAIPPSGRWMWELAINTPDTPGNYQAYYRMDHDGQGKFGPSLSINIIVEDTDSGDGGSGCATRGRSGDFDRWFAALGLFWLLRRKRLLG